MQVVRYLVNAARLRTLTAGAIPVLYAAVLLIDDRRLRWPAWLACLGIAAGLQIAANLSNDYFDGLRQDDRPDRLGPVRVTASGLLSPRTVLTAAILSTMTAAAAGGFAVWYGWSLFTTPAAPLLMLAAGMLCIIVMLLYSAGPFPLSKLGLGELLALLFFGPIPCGLTYAVSAGVWSPRAFLIGLVPGLFAVTLMAVNNDRDLVSDSRCGKMTLAARLGDRRAHRLTAALFVLPPSALAALLPCYPLGGLAGLAVLPLAVYTAAVYYRTPRGAALNQFLGRTGVLNLTAWLLFAAGTLLPGRVPS